MIYRQIEYKLDRWVEIGGKTPLFLEQPGGGQL